MRLNEERIISQIKKAIALKPTHITLMRKEKVSNGMRGGQEKPVKVAEFDVLIDDSQRNLVSENVNETGSLKMTRGVNLIAITEGFEIKEDDYFIIDNIEYKVTYPGMIVKGVCNADLEVVR